MQRSLERPSFRSSGQGSTFRPTGSRGRGLVRVGDLRRTLRRLTVLDVDSLRARSMEFPVWQNVHDVKCDM